MTTPAPAGSLGRWLAIVASVVVLATIVASVIVTGTPAELRESRLDARRTRDLENLAEAIQQHVNESGALPANLAVLAGKPGMRLNVADPVTLQMYDFQPSGPRTYRLCANFTTDTAITPPSTTPGYGYDDTEWPHGIGRHCFNRTTEATAK